MADDDSILAPKIGRALTSYYLYDIVQVVSTIFLTRWLVEYLGTMAYGYSKTVGSIIGYMALLDFGLGQTITKYVAEHATRDESGEFSEVVNSALGLYCILATLGFVVAASASPFIGYFFKDIPTSYLFVAKIYFLIAAFKSAVGLPASILGGINFGLGKVDIYNLGRFVSTVANFALVWLAIELGFNLAEIEALTLLAVLASAAFNYWAVKKYAPDFEFTFQDFTFSGAKKLVSFSIFFMINQVVVLLVFETDDIIIGATIGVSAVTAYAITQELAYAGMDVVFKLSDTLYPTFSGLDAAEEREQLTKIYLMATRYSVAVSVAVLVVIAYYGETIIQLWIGPEGFAGAGVLTLLALVVFIHTPVHVASQLIAACGRLKEITAMSVLEGVLNLGLSFMWVDDYGLFGVALATFVSMAITTSWYVPQFAFRFIEVNLPGYTARGVFPGLMAGAPAVAAVLGMRAVWVPEQWWWDLSQAVVCALVAAASLLALKHMSEDVDWQAVADAGPGAGGGEDTDSSSEDENVD